VVFVVGLGLFARELIGGGDVKLIAALSLWAGPDQFVWFMLVTTLAGGALSLVSLWYRRWGGLIAAHLATLGLATAGHMPASPDAPAESSTARSATLPYGVAIAAGGIAIIIELAKF
jgi:prepilin peptidase CpaA